MPAGPDHPLKKEPCRAVILDNKHLKRSPRMIDGIGQFQNIGWGGRVHHPWDHQARARKMQVRCLVGKIAD